MKKIPIPDKPLKNEKDIYPYIEALVFNCMHWLKIDGYIFFVYLPKDKEHIVHENASVNIIVDYPYKKFWLSIQQDSVDKMLAQPLSNTGYWRNVQTSIFHEIVHILLWKTEVLAKRRYTTPTEMEDENEALTDHLTHIVYGMLEDIRNKKNGK